MLIKTRIGKVRKVVNLQKEIDGIVRLMIYNDEFGTYLFGFKKLIDCSSEWDEWYETEKEAIESCQLAYGVNKEEWTKIPDPKPNTKHDRM